MLQIVDWVILSLAVYRVSLMMVSEDGSFSITYALRLFGGNVKPLSKGDKDDKLSKWQAWKDSLVSQGRPTLITNHFGKLLSCIYCTSVWVGLMFYPLYVMSIGTYFMYFFYGMALSTITILIHRYSN